MKKVLSLLVALVMLFSCAGLAEAGEEAKKKLIVGTNAEFAPFEFFDENGEIAGFDADLIEMIMTLLGYEYEIVSSDFYGLLSALETDQYDLAIAGMSITEERLESALFSTPYFNASQKIIVPVDSAIAGVADLPAKKVGVQLGTTGDIYMTEEVEGAEVVRYNHVLDAVVDLASGRLDAVMADAEPSKAYAAQYENLQVLPENISDEVYGIAAALDNQALIDEVNAALKIIMDEGYFDALYEVWFGEE